MSALKQKLSEKTDNQLLYYINHVDKHTEEAVKLAFDILQERNVVLPPDTSERIKIEVITQKEKKRQEILGPWGRNVVKDSDAPEYYSQSAIYIFSILFSVLFGSFLLAANCNAIGKKGWQVILSGFLYTAVTIGVLNSININLGLSGSYLINTVGVLIMYELFWKGNIGTETKYKAKPIWKPLIIAAILFIPYLYFIIKNTP